MYTLLHHCYCNLSHTHYNEWELIPDLSTDPIKLSVSVARSEDSTTTDRVDAPKWKGCAILTEYELQELSRKHESDAGAWKDAVDR